MSFWQGKISEDEEYLILMKNKSLRNIDLSGFFLTR
jgi:uncharacterized protein involved in tolerance to divalent cations